jgi:hypothetical protein
MTSQPHFPATDRTDIDDDEMAADQASASDYRAADTYPADTRPTGATSEGVGSQAAQDPDLIIVAGEVVEEDADPEAADPEAADPQASDTGPRAGDDLAESDRSVNDPSMNDPTGSDLTGSDLTGSDREDYATSGDPDLVAAEASGTSALTGATQPGATQRPADLGQQWHDIQAMFVDDPRGSVQLAAAAADSAVGALMETLHQRQSALAPAGDTSADPAGTEHLREALRSYRIFCQSLGEIGQRLAQPATMSQ